MAISEVVTPVRRRSRLRRWTPALILILAGIAVTLAWTWPAPELEKTWRNVWTMATVLVSAVLLLLWLLLLSGWTWRLRRRVLLVCLLAALGLVISIRKVSFTGHMRLLVEWWWSKTDEQFLAEQQQRQAQSGAVVTPLALDSSADDFPEYRGRQRDGIVNGPPLERDWQARPPRQLWRKRVGGGYAAFAVAGNLAVTIEQRGGNEVTVAYDTGTGLERWAHAHEALFSETLGGDGPRATPTIADGRVYSLGGNGQLLCLDARDRGKLLWQANILDQNENLHWGMCGSPLVYDNCVVVSPGKQRPGSHTLVAYDRKNGNRLWASGETRAAYSSPMLATFTGNVRQILLLDAEALAGYDPGTGQLLWSYPWPTENGINVSQPVVLEGDRVFLSSGYGHGCMMLRIARQEGKWHAQPLWGQSPLRTMRCKFTSPVAYQEHLYGLDEGVLVCLDAATGQRCWRDGHYDHGQLLRAGDLLVVLAENGDLALVEANPQRFQELGRIEVFDSTWRTWNNPAMAGGKAYLRNDKEMACYDLSAASP